MKRLNTFSFSVALALGLTNLTACKTVNLSNALLNDTNLVEPLVEKRETITATGYAVVSVQITAVRLSKGSWPFERLNLMLIAA